MPIKTDPPSAERQAQLEDLAKKVFRERASAFTRLRQRSGLSMDELAKAMGYRGSSSIQRYFAEDYDKAFRPELARAFRRALLGKGEPPITDADLQFLLEWKEMEPSDPAWAENEAIQKMVQRQMLIGPEVGREDKQRVSANLPLKEGEVRIEMPRFLSPKSADTLKNWLDHLSELATSEAEFYDRHLNQPLTPGPRKVWGDEK